MDVSTNPMLILYHIGKLAHFQVAVNSDVIGILYFCKHSRAIIYKIYNLKVWLLKEIEQDKNILTIT